jgi:3',5'-cyclic AMP phosphodiesterase CpdA
MTFVILTPALACPSLVKKGDSVDVLLAARTRDIADALSNVTYSVWKTNKEKSIDKKDIEILSGGPSAHISEYVVSAYKKRGFKTLVRAKINISEKKGLYQLHNPFSESVVTDILYEITPPPYLNYPLAADKCSESSFFSDEPVRLHHPVYIGEKEYLNIAHISDSHLAARMCLLEDRWNANAEQVWRTSTLTDEKPGEFSNFVTQFTHILKTINKDKKIDVIIHTGDILDYNRGFYNVTGENDLSRDYYFNRNWLLFYEILYHHYEKPVFTILGNHDYRLNPYAPNPVVISRRIREFFNLAPMVNLTRSEMNTIHEDPYALRIIENHLLKAPHAVHWYSVVINPLLDYQVFYGGMAFLMLDWNVGEDHEEGNPWADKVLSRRQWSMVKEWHKKVMDDRKRKRVVAVVAMHVSVFNPFPEMGDKELMTNPKTNVFYKSFLDRYDPEKDLVDGTFRLRRSEFIRLCLGNSQYGSTYTISPEKGIDMVLTGHDHRTTFFQVEGPHVYLRKPDTITKGPLFCNAICSGPLGIKNVEGGPERIQLQAPGHHVMYCDDTIAVQVHYSDLVLIREDARCSFGEVASGGGFEVLDTVIARPLLNPVYAWKITNLRKGSTITSIKIVTGLTRPVQVTKVPLGWKYTVDCDEFTCITCKAHDRGQGIFFEDSGDITIKVQGESAERIGSLTVTWDMNNEDSPPVCVRVPSER